MLSKDFNILHLRQNVYLKEAQEAWEAQLFKRSLKIYDDLGILEKKAILQSYGHNLRGILLHLSDVYLMMFDEFDMDVLIHELEHYDVAKLIGAVGSYMLDEVALAFLD